MLLTGHSKTWAATGPAPLNQPTTRDQVETLIRPYLQSDDPALWRLATDTFHQCVLGKLRPPELPLAHPWLTPGGNFRPQ